MRTVWAAPNKGLANFWDTRFDFKAYASWNMWPGVWLSADWLAGAVAVAETEIHFERKVEVGPGAS